MENVKHRHFLSKLLLICSLALTVGAFWYAATVEREQSQQEYRTQLFRSLIAATDHGLVVLEPGGHIIEWGPGAERIFGWKAREVVGSYPDFLMPSAYRKAHSIAMGKIRYDTSRPLVDVQCWAYNKAGELIPIHIAVASFRNHIGYYHVALFTLLNDTKTVTIDEKPQDTEPPPKPEIEESYVPHK